MNDEQKKHIDTACKGAGPVITKWLKNLVLEMCDGKIFTTGGSRWDKQCSRHEMMCEVAEALVRHDADKLFVDLVNAYSGRCDIANLPTYDGRRILDAAESKAPDLAYVIRRNGGTSFPILLIGPGTQKTFFEWKKIDHPELQTIYLRTLTKEKLNLDMNPETYNDFIFALCADLLLSRHPNEAAIIAKQVRWNDMDDHNKSNLEGLKKLATSQEAYEFNAYLRDMVRFTAENMDLPAVPVEVEEDEHEQDHGHFTYSPYDPNGP